MRPLALAPPPASPPCASFNGPSELAVQSVVLGTVNGGTTPGGVDVGPKCAVGAFGGSAGGFNRRGGVVWPPAVPARVRTARLNMVAENRRPHTISRQNCQLAHVIFHPSFNKVNCRT